MKQPKENCILANNAGDTALFLAPNPNVSLDGANGEYDPDPTTFPTTSDPPSNDKNMLFGGVYLKLTEHHLSKTALFVAKVYPLVNDI